MEIVVAFAPFIVYWGIAAMKLPELAVTAGLVISAGSILLRWRARQVKTLGVVTLAFFALNFFLTVVLQSSFFTTYGLVLTSGILPAD